MPQSTTCSRCAISSDGGGTAGAAASCADDLEVEQALRRRRADVLLYWMAGVTHPQADDARDSLRNPLQLDAPVDAIRLIPIGTEEVASGDEGG